MRAIYFDKSVLRVLATLALKKLWAGAVFAPTSPVRFADLPEPALPGPRGVRVRNRLCGICASDLHLVFVDVDPRVHPAALPGYSRIYLGHEVVSEVVEAGSEVASLKVGDRVVMKSRFLGPTCASQAIDPPCARCADGNYALCENQSAGLGTPGVGGGWGDGYTCQESELWRPPPELTDEDAALCEPLGCGVRAVLRRPPAPGEKALVLGCGVIGLGVIQAVRALAPGAAVYAAARHPHQVEAARRFGAEVLAGGDLLEATARATGARLYRGEFGNRTLLGGFDVIYDCVGGDETLGRSLRMARAGGAVVLVGVNLRPMTVDLTPSWHQEVDLVGSIAHGAESWNGRRISTFDLTAELVQAGKIRTAGLVTHRFPLGRWKEAIRTAADKRSGSVKVMLTPH